MRVHHRILNFVTRANWILWAAASLFSLWLSPPAFAFGIFCGGLLVTVNFHLLAKTLRRALAPGAATSHNVVIAKYYLRFLTSGFVIFALIAGRVVHPLGLVIGLSIVVTSIILATLREITLLIFKEAV